MISRSSVLGSYDIAETKMAFQSKEFEGDFRQI